VARFAIVLAGEGAPGAEACARSAAASAAAAGAEAIGVRGGFEGLLAGTAGPLDGTPLGAGRSPALRGPDGAAKAAAALGSLGAEALVVIGGEGAIQAAAALGRAGARVVAVPAAPENDVAGTDASLGVDSALNAIVARVEALRGPAIVDVPGKLTGYLALVGAAAAGAAGAILVERPFPWDRLPARLAAGARPVLLRAEGAGTADDAAARLGALVAGAAVERVPAAGFRAASASVFDRVAAVRLGAAAAESVLGGVGGKLVAWRGGKCLPVPIEEAAGKRRQVVPEVFELAKRCGVLFE
jgi:6-phosphofructokinase 1